MALVPAWDKRTGEPLAQLVPEHYFTHPQLGVNLSPTAPVTPNPKPADPEPTKPTGAKPADPKKEA